MKSRCCDWTAFQLCTSQPSNQNISLALSALFIALTISLYVTTTNARCITACFLSFVKLLRYIITCPAGYMKQCKYAVRCCLPTWLTLGACLYYWHIHINDNYCI